jgi:tetratricopeptide (TPR) repeat protein
MPDAKLHSFAIRKLIVCAVFVALAPTIPPALSTFEANANSLLAHAQQAKPATAAPPAQVNPATMLVAAQGFYRQGSFDLAIARYNEVLKADPNSGDAYAGIVRSYLKQDKIREADDALQKGLLVTPDDPDFKVAEAELLFRQGEIPEAGTLFDEVIASPPLPGQARPRANARAYLGAARVSAAKAMYAREHILITRAHAIDPSDPDVRKMWMQTLTTADRIKSLADYLNQPTNDDAETRARLTEHLAFLKASQTAQLGRCRQVSDVTTTQTTLVAVQSGSGNIQGMGLDVTINGKVLRLLLDTGASGILINRKLAGQARLKAVSDIRMSGVGDKPDSQAHLAQAESVRVGELEFQNCPVYVVDRFADKEDGIIGTNVFSQFLIEIDFPSSQLRLSPLPLRPGEESSRPFLKVSDEAPAAEPEAKPASDAAASSRGSSTEGGAPAPRYFDRYVAPEMHSYVQAFLMGHMLLVPTKINEGSEKLFLLDSGSFDNTITPESAEKVTKIHRAPRLDIRGLNGEVRKVFVADEIMLDFGHLRQKVPNMVAIDMSRFSRDTGTEISGTLGMVMLRLLKVRLDYRDALADFQYIAPKPRH